MAPLKPEDLHLSALPRSPLGQLKSEAVGELLQRAAWKYRETLAENKQLTKSVEELSRRVEELTAQVASLEEAAARRKNPASPVGQATRCAHVRVKTFPRVG